MFVTELPGSLEGAAGAAAGVGTQVVTANATAAGIHSAVLPMAVEPTALLLHAHHGLDVVNYQGVHGVGTANLFGIVAALATSGITYDLTELANLGSLF